jgi:hypothetical protein
MECPAITNCGGAEANLQAIQPGPGGVPSLVAGGTQRLQMIDQGHGFPWVWAGRLHKRPMGGRGPSALQHAHIKKYKKLEIRHKLTFINLFTHIWRYIDNRKNIAMDSPNIQIHLNLDF